MGEDRETRLTRAAATSSSTARPASTVEPEECHPLVVPRRRRPGRWLVGVAALGGAGLGVWLALAPGEAPTPVAIQASAPAVAASPFHTFRDCDQCPEMAVVPAGTFLMGAPADDPDAGDEERPRHPVTIAAPFAVGRTEVTFSQWNACVVDGGCGGWRPDHEGWGGGPRPVINVSWHDAKAYVGWLSRKTGKTYRLPTEAQWEYATRAGSTTAYWWGDAIGRDNAVCKDCGSRWDNEETAPVSSFRANPFGLFDVHGNVWEWVEDCWSPSYSAASPEGVPPLVRRGCARRVVRGGSWDTSAPSLRASARAWGEADGRDNIVGFRVATSDIPAEAPGPVPPAAVPPSLEPPVAPPAK